MKLRDIGELLADNFCGCCGAGIGEEYDWCSRCADHVLATGQMHERAYLAQFGVDCPYQEQAAERRFGA